MAMLLGNITASIQVCWQSEKIKGNPQTRAVILYIYLQ